MKTMADVLALPDDSRRLVKWSLSQGQVTVAEAAEFLGVEASIARRLLEELRNQTLCRRLFLSTPSGEEPGSPT